MEPEIITTDERYRSALLEVEQLAVLDPDPGPSEGARLKLLAHFVEDYERRYLAVVRNVGG